MFLGQRTEKRAFDWTSKTGKSFRRFGKVRTVVLLRCDECGETFERDGHSLSPKRRNNDVKHYCSSCDYSKLAQKDGIKSRLKNLRKKVGERTVDSCGYIRVYVGDNHSYSKPYGGAIREHILVMENRLGRSLEKGEVVHHIDGDKTNNSIDNLDVCTVQEHNACHAASEEIVFELYKKGLVGYDRDVKKYFLKACDI